MEKDTFKQRRQMLADMILNNELYVPMKAKEIAMLLDIPKAKRSELMEVLDSLVADGTIGVSKKGKYMKPENVALVGTFESTRRLHSRKRLLRTHLVNSLLIMERSS